jgi:FkbM family methyltransferase
MNFSLPHATRCLGKSLLETVLPIAERITGFQTAPGEYLPYRLKMLTGRYEAAEIALMRRFLRARHVIVDVGANVGYLTRFFAQAVGPLGKVYAFEPNPLIFPLLRRNVAKFRQVAVFDVGLSTNEAEMLLFVPGSNHAVASFVREYPATHVFDGKSGQLHSVATKLVRGDEFMAKIDIDNSDRRRERRIDILKVDVEGWELNVLAGLEKTIMSSKKITIFCEYNPSAQEWAGRTPRELLDWFLDRQFALSYPRNGELHALPPAMIDQFAETLEPQGYTTVFAQRV